MNRRSWTCRRSRRERASPSSATASNFSWPAKGPTTLSWWSRCPRPSSVNYLPAEVDGTVPVSPKTQGDVSAQSTPSGPRVAMAFRLVALAAGHFPGCRARRPISAQSARPGEHGGLGRVTSLVRRVPQNRQRIRTWPRRTRWPQVSGTHPLPRATAVVSADSGLMPLSPFLAVEFSSVAHATQSNQPRTSAEQALPIPGRSGCEARSVNPLRPHEASRR